MGMGLAMGDGGAGGGVVGVAKGMLSGVEGVALPSLGVLPPVGSSEARRKRKRESGVDDLGAKYGVGSLLGAMDDGSGLFGELPSGAALFAGRDDGFMVAASAAGQHTSPSLSPSLSLAGLSGTSTELPSPREMSPPSEPATPRRGAPAFCSPSAQATSPAVLRYALDAASPVADKTSIYGHLNEAIEVSRSASAGPPARPTAKRAKHTHNPPPPVAARSVFSAVLNRALSSVGSSPATSTPPPAYPASGVARSGHEIEILGRQLVDGVAFVHVHYIGLPQAYNKWVPLASVTSTE